MIVISFFYFFKRRNSCICLSSWELLIKFWKLLFTMQSKIVRMKQYNLLKYITNNEAVKEIVLICMQCTSSKLMRFCFHISPFFQKITFIPNLLWLRQKILNQQEKLFHNKIEQKLTLLIDWKKKRSGVLSTHHHNLNFRI